MSNKNYEDNKNVSVKKVVVQVGESDIVLDIEDAKQLQYVLNELFGKVVVDRKEDSNNYYWNYPNITYTVSAARGAGEIYGITTGDNTYSLNTSDGTVKCKSLNFSISSTIQEKFKLVNQEGK